MDNDGGNMLRCVVSIMLLFSLEVSGGLLANDDPVRHPVKWYSKFHPCVECPQDSALNGTITFSPLPEFMKPCRMRVEYYNGSDAEEN